MLKPCSIFIVVHYILFFSVTSGWGQDTYEDDDTYATANVIVINNETAQFHTFHEADDEDWVIFYALVGDSYAVKTFNLGSGVDTYIELYDTDGTTRLKSANFLGDPGHDDILDWTCNRSGVYYVKIKHAQPALFSEEAGYNLVLYYTDIFYLPSYLTGTVQSSTGQPISSARIQASGNKMNGTGLSTGDGSFLLSLEAGTYTLFVSANGFLSKTTTSVSVPGSPITINLVPTNTPPEANEDNFTVPKGGEVSGNVLLNDNDVDGDPLQAVLNRNVAHGTLLLRSNGSFIYNHNGDESLSDSFTYQANDGSTNSDSMTATIKITESKRVLIGPLLLLLN